MTTLPAPTTTILLVGRNQWVIDGARDALETDRLRVVGAITLDELTAVLSDEDVDHVFLGPGLDLDIRLEALRMILEDIPDASVHLKDTRTGPDGALDFVRRVLTALDDR